MSIDPKLYQGNPDDIVIDPTTGRSTMRKLLPGYSKAKGKKSETDKKPGYVRGDVKAQSILAPLVKNMNEQVKFLSGEEGGVEHYDTFKEAINDVVLKIEISDLNPDLQRSMIYNVKEIESKEKEYIDKYRNKNGGWIKLAFYLNNSAMAKAGLRVAKKKFNESLEQDIKKIVRTEVRRIIKESLL